ncbi:NAD(+)/NADH kinase [Desulfolutivibrio sulfoxidireducens]|uniref:NAD(+)/NADH kinase n=1 Tax=Desulfolutivibrio sulfoxidireducens TaxID=2773299 RepID=UPI00159DABBB|nr:NAD(+)/NADH kinase [Desulfolutivibrio sulfoxidireducens]QLA16853.1 NAD(+)/NADH kinase [Desulfolutivibrio sulfoxidireducens]QLA20418.1 NAD(+)/NADH kinase [Desulfolutivibrio sulfoxidireducens]
MSTAVHTVLLVFKTDAPKAHALALEIAGWLSDVGVVTLLRESQTDPEKWPVPRGRGADPARDPDLAIILGGDGTILSEARRTRVGEMPILGINLGRVGFLTALGPKNWRPALSDVLENGFSTVTRMCLDVAVIRDGERVFFTRAINDAVVGRGTMARLVELRLEYGGEYVCDLRADGLIVATPTGATAYCVSAGGPLVHPDLGVYCVTPVCPFQTDFKPMVLPASAPVAVTILDPGADMHLTTDGQEGFPLRARDQVLVSPASRGITLVTLRGETYFEKLRRKGFVGQR